MIEINLVPDVKQELLKAQRARSIVVSIAILIGIAAVIVVVLLAMYVYGAQQLISRNYDGRIQEDSAELANVEDLSKTLTIQNQLAQIGAINDARKAESRLFDVLNAIIPSDPADPNRVAITRLALDTSDARTITLEAQAVNSYQAAEVFTKTIDAAMIRFTPATSGGEEASESEGGADVIERKLATDIQLSEINYGEDSSGAMVLRFTVQFTYAEDLFTANTSNFRIWLSTTGNVTDSYLGVPRSIFADPIPTEEEGS